MYSSVPPGLTDYYNQRWYDYTGLSVEDSLSDKWTHAVHPDDLEPLYKEWQRCIAAGQPCEMEFRLRGRDGVYRWFLSRSLPVFDEQGEIIRWIGTSTDIDNLKRAKAS